MKLLLGLVVSLSFHMVSGAWSGRRGVRAVNTTCVGGGAFKRAMICEDDVAPFDGPLITAHSVTLRLQSLQIVEGRILGQT
jgi:hypothetical protein